MKGLFLKELIVMRKAMWVTFLIEGLITVVAVISKEWFMLIYIPILLGMYPTNSMTLDEKSGWDKFSLTLPYRRRDIVSFRYILSLILDLIGFGIISLLMLSIMKSASIFTMQSWIFLNVAAFCFSLLTIALLFPLSFRLGTVSARTAAFIILGVGCGLTVTFMNTSDFISEKSINSLYTAAAAVLAITTVIYAASWFISIRIVQKKDF